MGAYGALPSEAWPANLSPTMHQSTRQSSSHLIVYALLTLVVIAGFALRVWNLNFDRGIGSHPDERSTACFYAPTIHLPSSWAEFRDPHQSPLNPLWDVARQERRSFTYGHFPLYLGISMGEVWRTLAPTVAPAVAAVGMPAGAVQVMQQAGDSCDAMAVAGRFTIALLDTVTIVLIFMLGRRIFGAWPGLLAATLYAFTAQAIQLSHFFAMDPASTTFTVMAILGAVALAKRLSLVAAVVTGLGMGLAIASKFSALPILLAPFVAVMLANWREATEAAARTDEEGTGQAVPRDTGFRAMGALLTALAVALVSFAVTSPYAILDWQSFIQATLIEQGRMVRGIADMPFTRQYRNTIPYVYFIQQQIEWGMWWPLGLIALAGTLYMLGRLLYTLYRMAADLLRRRAAAARTVLGQVEIGNLVMWSWVAPYFLLTGAFLAKFNRYMSPILPFVVLFSAGMIGILWAQGAKQPEPAEANPLWRPLARLSAGVLAVIAVAGGLFWSVAYVNGVYGHEHTWITASRWLYEHAPEGSAILWEQWDDPLPKGLDEPGMNMGAHGLYNIDWGPYEEDSAEKYEVLKAKLREAEYVAYSSKRIYDSVDELPERYPMTNRYYQAMWDGELGYEMALDVTSPPRLFGWVFQDRGADESWSLYDHPQVTIFRKVRDLSDAEFDAVLGGSWESAVPYYRGQDSPLSPLFGWMGLGNSATSEYSGVIGKALALVSGAEVAQAAPQADEPSLMLETELASLPLVDNYRWNEVASSSPWLASLVWWGALLLLGVVAWPLAWLVLRPLRDRGYLLSRTVGWLVAGWLLWVAASTGMLYNTVRNAWIAVGVLAGISLVIAIWKRRELAADLRGLWPLLLAGEALFAAAFVGWLLVRMANPDLWQPWYGGEKFMEFAFLNGILRSPTFPPVDPHFAGGYVNYYYYGLYLVALLIKLTGIHAEVGFNLAIASLFALTALNAFAIAYHAWGWGSAIVRNRGEAEGTESRPAWRAGLGAALLGPLFVAVIGNLDGAAQIVRQLADAPRWQVQSVLPGLATLSAAASGVADVVRGTRDLPGYDFWGPSRVIPFTINEFPYWSFLYADLHPHLIGMPLTLLFLGLVATILSARAIYAPGAAWYRLLLLAAFGLVLGTLASVNLWELPTYFMLGVLAYMVGQFRWTGRVSVVRTGIAALTYLACAYLFFRPFFHNYANIGASGIGLVRSPDSPGLWLLVWGCLGFVTASWLILATAQRPRRCRQPVGEDGAVATLDDLPCAPTGVERVVSLALRKFDQLPRLIDLHRRLVRQGTSAYRAGVLILPVAAALAVALLLAGWGVLALCVVCLGIAWLLLWRRGADSDPGALLAAVLATTACAILAGTQIVFLKDFLEGGEWYRMNTLFKFFIQVWIMLGVAAAIAVPRIWRVLWPPARPRVASESEEGEPVGQHPAPRKPPVWVSAVWTGVFALLLAGSLTFLVFGTPARLMQRMVGWRPPFGTLDGLEYMREGSYRWPTDADVIPLHDDWAAIQWLLDTVRGNPVIAETSEVDYYRAGSTRIASMTGISGLRGMHESEQRFGDALAVRAGQHQEFWDTPDPARTLELIDELDISLIYVGQLEARLHPAGVAKLEAMAAAGQITPIYQAGTVTIYAVPGRLTQDADGHYYPTPTHDREVG